MPRALLIALAALLAIPASQTLPMTASVAEAHPAPYAHRHVYKVRPRHRVRVVRPVRVQPVRTVVVEEEPSVVVTRPAPVVRAEPEEQRLAIGVRVTGAGVEGAKAGLSDEENGAMGGIGIQLRSRLDEHLGIELSIDALGTSGEDFEQQTIPIMASLTYHLFPESRLQPYALAGAGVQFTSLDYLGGQYAIETTELAGQIGAGLELFLTRDLSINADIRAQSVFKNLDSQAKIQEDCLQSIGGMSGFCDGIHEADPNDKINLGAQFSLGLNLHF